jgi:hypothetical protein
MVECFSFSDYTAGSSYATGTDALGSGRIVAHSEPILGPHLPGGKLRAQILSP